MYLIYEKLLLSHACHWSSSYTKIISESPFKWNYIFTCRRVLHRDLKSRNIFLKDNQIKIGDFGISKILIGTSDKASTFVGTPYYMSPEVLNHEDYDEKCDIW